MHEFSDEFEKFYPRLDQRYAKSAYYFVLATVASVVSRLSKPRHVSGQELLDGLIEFGRRNFGPLTGAVFSEWGIEESLDFGRIVFELIAVKLLGKTERDAIEDFAEYPGFDKLDEEFDFLA